MAEHANALALDQMDLVHESHEVVRVWVTNNAGSNVVIDARVLHDPEVFGYLMSDTIRHAARAYSTTWGMSEVQALQSILDGLMSELREQIGEITTIQPGSLD